MVRFNYYENGTGILLNGECMTTNLAIINAPNVDSNFDIHFASELLEISVYISAGYIYGEIRGPLYITCTFIEYSSKCNKKEMVNL